MRRYSRFARQFHEVHGSDLGEDDVIDVEAVRVADVRPLALSSITPLGWLLLIVWGLIGVGFVVVVAAVVWAFAMASVAFLAGVFGPTPFGS